MIRENSLSWLLCWRSASSCLRLPFKLSQQSEVAVSRRQTFLQAPFCLPVAFTACPHSLLDSSAPSSHQPSMSDKGLVPSTSPPLGLNVCPGLSVILHVSWLPEQAGCSILIPSIFPTVWFHCASESSAFHRLNSCPPFLGGHVHVVSSFLYNMTHHILKT